MRFGGQKAAGVDASEFRHGGKGFEAGPAGGASHSSGATMPSPRPAGSASLGIHCANIDAQKRHRNALLLTRDRDQIPRRYSSLKAWNRMTVFRPTLECRVAGLKASVVLATEKNHEIQVSGPATNRCRRRLLPGSAVTKARCLNALWSLQILVRYE